MHEAPLRHGGGWAIPSIEQSVCGRLRPFQLLLMSNVSQPKSMHRNRVATITSAALLAAMVLIWRDLFFFAKVVFLPAWTASLPSPIDTPRYLAFLGLLPAAFFTSSLFAAVRAVAWALLVAPLPALVVYLAGETTTGADPWFNAAFHYVWIVAFHGLAPALLLLAARAAACAVKRRVAGECRELESRG